MDSYTNKLAQSESGGDYSVVNKQGYSGKYQWGSALLQDYNQATGQNLTMTDFLASPAIQEEAQAWSNARTDAALAPYVGTTVNGVTLDRDALRSIAHLGGLTGAKKYVTSGGAYDPSDANGTSLTDYAKKFAGWNYTAAQNDATYPTGTNALATAPMPQDATRNKLADLQVIQSLLPTNNYVSYDYKLPT